MRLRPKLRLDLLSGFLGSGKSTLLRRHLAAVEKGERVAVLINELGEVSIDHRLVRYRGDAPRAIAAGCACCTVAEELRAALLDILSEDAREAASDLDRIVIETSGLADPASILSTIQGDLVLAEYLDIGCCVVAFDALDGIDCARAYAEARHQLAAADTVVITKMDLVDADRARAVEAFVRDANSFARIERAASPEFDVAALFAGLPSTPRSGAVPVHTGAIQSFCLSFDTVVDWASFSVWLTCMLNRHGARVLRFKGILESEGGALVVHGVRHVVYPPQHLPRDGAPQSRSDLVFIVDGLDPVAIESSLRRFLAFAAPFVVTEHTSRAAKIVDAASLNQ